jgi:hypothetical protein
MWRGGGVQESVQETSAPALSQHGRLDLLEYQLQQTGLKDSKFTTPVMALPVTKSDGTSDSDITDQAIRLQVVTRFLECDCGVRLTKKEFRPAAGGRGKTEVNRVLYKLTTVGLLTIDKGTQPPGFYATTEQLKQMRAESQ